MILVTGGTGFIGRELVRHLVQMGETVRVLLRPSLESPRIPRNVSVEVAVCSLKDERGLRAALRGVDVVFHLASSEYLGTRADLNSVDIEGSEMITKVSAQAGVDRFFYLSHIGADKSSAYPVLKAKALAEGAVIESGIDYTVFRSTIAFGENDHFTTSLLSLGRLLPFFFILPGDGSTLIQPIWVRDLITCMGLSLEEKNTRNQIITVGGSEYFTFRQAVDIVMSKVGITKYHVPLNPPYLRFLSLIADQLNANFPISIYWLDYLASDRICEIDSLPRLFGLIPARFNHKMLSYLN